MLNSKDILNFIYKTIKSILNDEDLIIKTDAKLVDDLGLQSIDFADLLNQTELNLNINLPNNSKEFYGKEYKEMTFDDYLKFVLKIYSEKYGK